MTKTRDKRPKIKDRKSLILIEVVIAMLLLGALLASIMNLFTQGVGYSSKYKRKITGWGLMESAIENKCSSPVGNNTTWNQTVNGFDYNLIFNASNDTANYTNGTGNYSFGQGNLTDCSVNVNWCENNANASCNVSNSTSFSLSTRIANY
jgi:hypothetical protein